MLRFDIGAVVVAQLAERSLPTSEIRDRFPTLAKFFEIIGANLSIAIQKRRK